MHKISAAMTAVALVAVLTVPAHAANLLTNGSFEDTTGFVNNGQDTMVLNPGSTTLTGWGVVTNQIAWIGPTNPFGLTAIDGSYFLDLQSYTDDNPFGAVTQSIATVAGATYQLSYELGGSTHWNGDNPDLITACGGGTCQSASLTATSLNQWAAESFDFTATGSSTAITFSGGGANGILFIGLDDVSVVFVSGPSGPSVPEPGTLVLLAIGLLATTFAMRRRRKLS